MSRRSLTAKSLLAALAVPLVLALAACASNASPASTGDADPSKPIVIAQHISGIASKTRGLQRLDQVRRRLCRLDAHQIPVGSVIHRPLLDTHIHHDGAGLAP